MPAVRVTEGNRPDCCNTRGVRSCRVTLTWLLVLAAVLLSVPAAAMATSAGDNQYTDPLAGQGNHHGSGGSQTPTGSTPQTPAPTPAPTPTPTASSSSGNSTTPLSASSTATSPSGATTVATNASAASSRTLPRTGFDAGLGAAIGVSLIGIGLMTRRRIRYPSR
jgi:LPXTG-motif cell wall-anchored protein